MQANIRNTTLKLTTMAVLVAVSVVLVLLLRIPLIPAAPFLMYDMADVPVLIGSMMFGPVAGLVILVIVSTIQAFLLSPDGWVGLVMHVCASGALVLVSSLFYRHFKTVWSLIVGLVLGSLCMTALMVPLNYIFTVNVYGTPKEALDALVWPGIIPFNLIKSLGNSVITLLVYLPVRRFLPRLGSGFSEQAA